MNLVTSCTEPRQSLVRQKKNGLRVVMWEKAGKNGDNLVIFERISGRGRPLITMLSMSVGNLGGKFSKYRQTKLRQASCRAEHGHSHGCGGDV